MTFGISKQFRDFYAKSPMLACLVTLILSLATLAIAAGIAAGLATVIGPVAYIVVVAAAIIIAPTFCAAFFLGFEAIAVRIGYYRIFRVKGRPIQQYVTKLAAAGCVIVAAPLGLGGAAFAEINNPTNPFENITPCTAYDTFLSGEGTITTIEACSPIVKFLIAADSDQLDTQDFLAKLATAGNKSALGALATLAYLPPTTNPIARYQAAQSAATVISKTMGKSQDDERAALYSNLALKIQDQTVAQLCATRTECGVLPDLRQTVSSSMGPEFKDFDSADAEATLACLLRTDGYATPIRAVLRSPKFEFCIIE